MTLFERLLRQKHDPHLLLGEYDAILADVFTRPLWETGSIHEQRVRWTDGWRARKADSATFGSIGLYIWGAAQRPMYIGIAVGRNRPHPFKSRFRRYIFGRASQCNLASRYCEALQRDGIAGFPPEVREEYQRSHPGTTVRLQHAVRFAEEGLDEIWFMLLAHAEQYDIKPLEDALVPVANQWNLRRGLRPLLNARQR